MNRSIAGIKQKKKWHKQNSLIIPLYSLPSLYAFIFVGSKELIFFWFCFISSRGRLGYYAYEILFSFRRHFQLVLVFFCFCFPRWLLYACYTVFVLF